MALLCIVSLCIVSLWIVGTSFGPAMAAGTPGSGEDPLSSLPGIITAGADRVIKRWDMSGRLASVVGNHEDTVNAIAFVPGSGGDRLLSVGADGQLKLWNTRNATLVRAVDTQHGAVTALAVSPDGRLAATGGTDQTLRLWSLPGLKLLTEVKGHADTISVLQFARDGTRLISGSADRLIRLWRVEDQGTTLNYHSTIQAHDAAVTGLVLTADDLIASVAADGYLKIWDPVNGSLRNHVRAATRDVLAISLSPDGRTIATGDAEGKIRLWNTTNCMLLPFTGSHDRAVTVLAWTPDGSTLISGSADKTVRYWNVNTGRQIARIAAHDGAIRAIAVVP
jgi:WD40 repeat protein